jgi:hypothetical protein
LFGIKNPGGDWRFLPDIRLISDCQPET